MINIKTRQPHLPTFHSTLDLITLKMKTANLARETFLSSKESLHSAQNRIGQNTGKVSAQSIKATIILALYHS